MNTRFLGKPHGHSWSPLRENFFNPPELSSKEKAYLIRKSCEAARQVVLRARSNGGPIEWRHIEKTSKGVQVYAGYSRTATTNKEPTSMCGVTSIPGTVNEVASLFHLSTTKAMREFSIDNSELFYDALVLYTLCPRTKEKPLHQITAKWIAVRTPSDIADRDFCYLECQDKFMDSNGKKGWVLCLHSIKLPGCDELYEQFGFVRGSFYHSGFVIVESDRPGFVDAIHMVQLNLKNNTKTPLSMMKQRVIWVDRIRSMMRVKRLNEQRYLNDLELVPKKYRSRCSVCQVVFGMLLLKKMNCRKCGEVICGACSSELQISRANFLEDVKLRICIHCFQMITTGDTSNDKVVLDEDGVPQIPRQPPPPVILSRQTGGVGLLGYHEDAVRASVITQQPAYNSNASRSSSSQSKPAEIYLQSMRDLPPKSKSRNGRSQSSADRPERSGVPNHNSNFTRAQTFLNVQKNTHSNGLDHSYAVGPSYPPEYSNNNSNFNEYGDVGDFSSSKAKKQHELQRSEFNAVEERSGAKHMYTDYQRKNIRLYDTDQEETKDGTFIYPQEPSYHLSEQIMSNDTLNDSLLSTHAISSKKSKASALNSTKLNHLNTSHTNEVYATQTNFILDEENSTDYHKQLTADDLSSYQGKQIEGPIETSQNWGSGLETMTSFHPITRNKSNRNGNDNQNRDLTSMRSDLSTQTTDTVGCDTQYLDSDLRMFYDQSHLIENGQNLTKPKIRTTKSPDNGFEKIESDSNRQMEFAQKSSDMTILDRLGSNNGNSEVSNNNYEYELDDRNSHVELSAGSYPDVYVESSASHGTESIVSFGESQSNNERLTTETFESGSVFDARGDSYNFSIGESSGKNHETERDDSMFSFAQDRESSMDSYASQDRSSGLSFDNRSSHDSSNYWNRQTDSSYASFPSSYNDRGDRYSYSSEVTSSRPSAQSQNSVTATTSAPAHTLSNQMDTHTNTSVTQSSIKTVDGTEHDKTTTYVDNLTSTDVALSSTTESSVGVQPAKLAPEQLPTEFTTDTSPKTSYVKLESSDSSSAVNLEKDKQNAKESWADDLHSIDPSTASPENPDLMTNTKMYLSMSSENTHSTNSSSNPMYEKQETIVLKKINSSSSSSSNTNSGSKQEIVQKEPSSLGSDELESISNITSQRSVLYHNVAGFEDELSDSEDDSSDEEINFDDSGKHLNALRNSINSKHVKEPDAEYNHKVIIAGKKKDVQVVSSAPSITETKVPDDVDEELEFERKMLLSAPRIYKNFGSTRQLLHHIGSDAKNTKFQSTFDQIQASIDLMSSDSEDESDDTYSRLSSGLNR